MDTKSKTHEANPQKGFVVQINASENFGLDWSPVEHIILRPVILHAKVNLRMKDDWTQNYVFDWRPVLVRSFHLR